MTFHKEKPSCAVLRDDGFQSPITEKHRKDNRRASTGPDKTTIGDEGGRRWMDEVEQVCDSNQLPLLMALDHNRLFWEGGVDVAANATAGYL